MTNEQILMEIRNVIKQNNQTKVNVNETLTHATNIIRTLEKKCSTEYERGLNDAWEAAKKIVLPIDMGGLNYYDLHDIFGTDYTSDTSFSKILSEVSPNKAINLIRDYENSKSKKSETSKVEEKKDYKIIAVDFDGTLCEDKWPKIGKPKEDVIEYLKTLSELGHKIILWTCRSGELLNQAVNWCNHRDLYFDAVNQNLPEVIEQMGGDSRKIHADIYLDDKSLANIYQDDIG